MQLIHLYNDLSFEGDSPLVKVILETSFTKEIRILLANGQQMKEHKSPFPIMVEVVDGAINFGVNGQVYELARGNLISLKGDISHNLIATENSIIRLTLSKFDTVQRVKAILN